MIRRLSTAFMIALAVSIQLPAQQSMEPLDTAAIAQIKADGFEHSHAMELLHTLSDVYGPRLNWSPEYRDAAEWAMKTLRAWGVENVHTENIGPVGRGWTLKRFTAQVLEPRAFPLIAWPKAWSPSTRGTVRGDVIYLDAKTDADLEKYHGKLKNAIVLAVEPIEIHPHFTADAERLSDADLMKLANAGPPMPRQRRGRYADTSFFRRYRERALFNAKKAEFCMKEGAAVILDAGRGDDGTLGVAQATVPQPPPAPGERMGARVNAYDPDAPKILPQITLAAEHYNRLVRMLQAGEHVRMEIDLGVEFTEADSSFNVIGEIPGTDLKDEVVLIGGHFDSWQAATGGTDNATGVTTVMETARILKTLGIRPRRTIRFALWGGEEQGLYGSRGYVSRHLAEREGTAGAMMFGAPAGPIRKLPEYDRFSVYLNYDNGAGRVRGIYLQGNEAARTIFRAWFTQFGDSLAQTISLSNTGGTDHQSFDAVGLPGFQFIQDPLDYDVRTHHTNMDFSDRVPEEDLKQSCVVMAVFAYNAAMRDAMFPRKPMPAGR